jgi:molecular chaperone GrpE
MNNDKKERNPAGQGESENVSAEKAPESEASAGSEDMEALRIELAAEHDRYMRVLAEYDNYRKRSARERDCLYGDVRAETAERFLPVYDNLSLALSHPTADEAYRKGVEMTMNQLREVLAELGIEEIRALGETFDPALHNAVMHVEDDDAGEGVIVEEFRKGFTMGDKVIRCSMVKVAN